MRVRAPVLRPNWPLVFYALGGIALTVATAVACAAWMPGELAWDVYRIVHHSPHKWTRGPDYIYEDKWRPGQWIVIDPDTKRGSLQDPATAAKFDRIERFMNPLWMSAYGEPKPFSPQEIGHGVTGFGHSHASVFLLFDDRDSVATVNLFWSGWPARCFRGGYLEDEGRKSWGTRWPPLAWRTAVECPWWLRPSPLAGWPRVLPYGVMWPGLAVNTAFFASVFWLVGWSRGMLVGVVRQRRGRCANCGYDRRGLASIVAACPECGFTPKDGAAGNRA